MKDFIKYLNFVLTLSVLFLLSSCSQQGKYKVLSTLFDGVPNPDSIYIVKNEAGKDSLKSLNVLESKNTVNTHNFIHPPYEERNCSICHQSSFSQKLNETVPELCYSCHEDFSKSFSFLHGPVVSGKCTECHNPHESKIAKLLNREGQKLCLNCHNISDVSKNEVHKGLENDNCLDCHNPHGGKDRFLNR